MCEPIAITSIALAVVGAGISYVGSVRAQNAQNEANTYNAANLARNAEIKNQEATRITQQGDIAEKQHRLEVAGFKGTQRATASGSGLLVDSGSNLDLTKDTVGFGELDALTIRNNASVMANAKRNEAADLTSQSSLVGNQNVNPFLPGAGSLLSGLSSAGQSYYSYKKTTG